MPSDVRTNAPCPGAINTRAAEIVGKAGADDFRRRQAAAHLLGRIGEPEDIASAVCFLASDDSSFITGAAMVVDGGSARLEDRPRDAHDISGNPVWAVTRTSRCRTHPRPPLTTSRQ
ncbi:MAG: SDR family oxidoreductase [Candidatus Rokuibacteriota bacterium]